VGRFHKILSLGEHGIDLGEGRCSVLQVVLGLLGRVVRVLSGAVLNGSTVQLISAATHLALLVRILLIVFHDVLSSNFIDISVLVLLMIACLQL